MPASNRSAPLGSCMVRQKDTRSLVISFKPHSTTWELPDWFVNDLSREFPEVHGIYLPHYQGLDDAIEQAEIFVGLSLRSSQASRARKLRWVHSLYAAVNHLLV